MPWRSIFYLGPHLRQVPSVLNSRSIRSESASGAKVFGPRDGYVTETLGYRIGV
jgi:hypothetical protein